MVGETVKALDFEDEKNFSITADKGNLDVPAQVVNDRTLVPVRAISESFGCQVGWEEETQTVTITVQ